MLLRNRIKQICTILIGIVMCVVVLAACDIKTYNMVDPGRPSDTFVAFYKAVSDGDDNTANELLYNFSWHSCMPQVGASEDEYIVNGIALSGADARVLKCLLQSRSCSVVSESDYTKDALTSSVTVSYTSFDISRFQKELTSRSIEVVKKKQYHNAVFKDENDTKDIIEKNKNREIQN